MAERIIRFLKGVSPYNATEIAGFPEDRAKEYVSRGWAEWYSEDEIPEDVGIEADAGGESGPGPDDPSTWTVGQLRAHLEDHEIDPDELEGSGSGGNVVKADLLKAVEALPT